MQQIVVYCKARAARSIHHYYRIYATWLHYYYHYYYYYYYYDKDCTYL